MLRTVYSGILSAVTAFLLIGAIGCSALSQQDEQVTERHAPEWLAEQAEARTAGADDLTLGYVERLESEHGCWTDAAPADVIPGHAIVALPGAAPKRANARVGFDIWLGEDGQPQTGDERGGVVYAFCP